MRWVDIDNCPCEKCVNPMAICSCEKYRTWQNGADVAPVKHGHWIFGNSIGDKCSVCGFLCGHHDYDNADNYCSHCGAKMDEVNNNELL